MVNAAYLNQVAAWYTRKNQTRKHTDEDLQAIESAIEFGKSLQNDTTTQFYQAISLDLSAMGASAAAAGKSLIPEKPAGSQAEAFNQTSSEESGKNKENPNKPSVDEAVQQLSQVWGQLDDTKKQEALTALKTQGGYTDQEIAEIQTKLGSSASQGGLQGMLAKFGPLLQSFLKGKDTKEKEEADAAIAKVMKDWPTLSPKQREAAIAKYGQPLKDKVVASVAANWRKIQENKTAVQEYQQSTYWDDIKTAVKDEGYTVTG